MKKIIFFLLISMSFTIAISQVPSEFVVHCAMDNDLSNPVLLSSSSSSPWCSVLSSSTQQYDLKFIPTSNYAIHYVQVNMIYMTENANILIKNGGAMTMNGSIVNTFSDNWNGYVKVQSGGSLVMTNNAIIEKCSGGFTVEQGAVFEMSEGEIK